jgi:hypothetical protein
VVVDFVLENSWFVDDYNPLKPTSPACYALGREEADLAPHADSADAQSGQCEGCQHNEWGSNRKGGRGKDCKNTRRIGVIPADTVAKFIAGDKDAIRKASVVMCKLPVTSIKAFSKFVNQIVRVLETHPFTMIVELSVTPDPVNQFVVNWKVLDQIKHEDALQQLYEKHMATEKLMFQPYPKMEEEAPAQQQSKKY